MRNCCCVCCGFYPAESQSIWGNALAVYYSMWLFCVTPVPLCVQMLPHGWALCGGLNALTGWCLLMSGTSEGTEPWLCCCGTADFPNCDCKSEIHEGLHTQFLSCVSYGYLMSLLSSAAAEAAAAGHSCSLFKPITKTKSVCFSWFSLVVCVSVYELICWCVLREFPGLSQFEDLCQSQFDTVALCLSFPLSFLTVFSSASLDFALSYFLLSSCTETSTSLCSPLSVNTQHWKPSI